MWFRISGEADLFIPVIHFTTAFSILHSGTYAQQDFHIARNDLYRLFDAFPQLERSWQLQEEQALLGKIEREVELLTLSPVERYQRLLERSPHIFQIIRRKYIASYLRMTPETMSRLAFV